MSQRVPFHEEDAGASRVGEHAPERRRRSDAALNRAKILDETGVRRLAVERLEATREPDRERERGKRAKSPRAPH